MAKKELQLLPVRTDKEVLKAFYTQHPYIKVETIKIKLNDSPISDLTQLGTKKVQIGALEVTTPSELTLIFPVFIYEGELQPLDVALTNKTNGYTPINKDVYQQLTTENLATGAPIGSKIIGSKGAPLINKLTGTPPGVSTMQGNGQAYSFRGLNILKTASASLFPNLPNEMYSAKNKKWLRNKIASIAQKGEFAKMAAEIQKDVSKVKDNPGLLIIRGTVQKGTILYPYYIDYNVITNQGAPFFAEVNSVRIYRSDMLRSAITKLLNKDDETIYKNAKILLDKARKTVSEDVIRFKYVLPINPIRYATKVVISERKQQKEASAENILRYDILSGDIVNNKVASGIPNDFLLDPISEKDLLAKGVPIYLLKTAEDGTPMLSQPLLPWDTGNGTYVLIEQSTMTPIRLKHVMGLKKTAAVDSGSYKTVFIGDNEILVRLMPAKEVMKPVISLAWSELTPYNTQIIESHPVECSTIEGTDTFILPAFPKQMDTNDIYNLKNQLALILGYYGVTQDNVLQDITHKLYQHHEIDIALSIVYLGGK